MIDWLTLIPAGLSLLGGIFGGDKKSTSTTGNSPALDAAAKKVFGEASKIYSKPYVPYTGQRVAPTTASRDALSPLMSQIGGQVMGGMNDSSGLLGRARDLMGVGPQRVGVPTMVPGGPSVSMNAAPNLQPQQYTQPPQGPLLPSPVPPMAPLLPQPAPVPAPVPPMLPQLPTPVPRPNRPPRRPYSGSNPQPSPTQPSGAPH